MTPRRRSVESVATVANSGNAVAPSVAVIRNRTLSNWLTAVAKPVRAERKETIMAALAPESSASRVAAVSGMSRADWHPDDGGGAMDLSRRIAALEQALVIAKRCANCTDRPAQVFV